MARQKNGEPDFKVNNARLKEICVRAYESWDEKLRKHLPQWNLPLELEHNPIKTFTADPYQASLFLWTEAFLERMTKSSIIVKNALRAWSAPEMRWIFYPEQVVERKVEEIDDIIRGEFQFGLQGRGEEPPQKRYLDNAVLLTREYAADPRNLVRFKTVAEARKHIQRFKGIGTGIANLFMIYLME